MFRTVNIGTNLTVLAKQGAAGVVIRNAQSDFFLPKTVIIGTPKLGYYLAGTSFAEPVQRKKR